MVDFRSIVTKVKNFKMTPAEFQRFLKTVNERQILKVIVALLLLFLLIGMLLQEDPADGFKKTVERFVRATAEYDPEDSIRYTTDKTRALVMAQAERVAKARANGLKTSIETVQTNIVSQRSNYISAEVLVNTVESWPGKEPTRYTHVFVMEGERVSQQWKITKILELQTSQRQ
ncbi:hypothetical protein [Anaeromusa acidaminophila]|uniref:hypothetical protein n=1 Tax=Anaeromusa acidaminophila TaxID=81464 RepID=UPI00037FECE4|nr:hypothetical protein [Anaeromusa acidaminophila]